MSYPRTKQMMTERRAAAEERRKVHDERTPQQQLALLDKRPGSSKRERSKLERLIASMKSKT